jgi:hydrogenase maturation protein HypF
VSAKAEGADRAVPAALLAARFHNALAQWIAGTARSYGITQLALSGGVFQNQYLTERVTAFAIVRGVLVFTHQVVPANHGGTALGQAMLAGAAWEGI